MLRFIGWRVLQFPLVLACIYLITFLLIWAAPGNPFDKNDRATSQDAKRAVEAEYHTATWEQFLAYYPRRLVLHADFGQSFDHDGWTVNDILATSLPISVDLGLLAMTIAVIAGVALGTLAAVRRGGVSDWLSLGVSLVGISLPSFVTAAILLIVFAAHLKWFGVGGWGSLGDVVLPAVALSLMPMAYIARLTRVAMLDVLSNDYVRTARAKGLSPGAVIWRHCLRNAALPVLSYLGPAAAATLTGSFVVEKVFNIPGLGQHFVDSITNRDRPLILGTVLVYSAFVLVLNLLTDIAYVMVDPRIELGSSREMIVSEPA